jgi:hypothetical protein
VVGGGALRGMSFGDRWIEVCTVGRDKRALDRVIAERGRTGPKSMRVDDAVVRLIADAIEVQIGKTRVGLLGAADGLRYTPALRQAGCPVESSGIVLIDAEGHPGTQLKLYLPDPDMFVPANTLDLAVPLFPAHDRAGGLTLARRKSDHGLIEAATASWWSGAPRSAWIVLTRTGEEITASMDAMPLPALYPDRTAALRQVWDAQHHDLPQMQFETQVYEIKAGRQINVRYH